jgi:ABC-2 type transport system permease protein
MEDFKPIEQYTDRNFDLRRIGFMGLRYLFLLRSSWTRIVELAYWPIMQMVLWGFMSQFLLTSPSPVIKTAGMLIAAVLLWDVMFRSNIGVAVSFLEEMWSRNLAQLFASPLRPYEWALSLLFISLVRTIIGVIPAAILAIPFYSYSIFDMGIPLIAFFMNLMIFGGAIGLVVSALVLRYGMGAESLAWVGIFLVAPISGIYYPISILPEWLQPIAWALPSAHIFEGMRAVLAEGVFRTELLINAIMLNVLYIGAGFTIFLYVFRLARIKGFLVQMGE